MSSFGQEIRNPESRDLLHPFGHLSDELLAEVFSHLEDYADQRNISLVCRRWLHVQRQAKRKLGLCIPSDSKCCFSCFSILSLLKRHLYLSSLSIVSDCSSVNREFASVIVKTVARNCRFLRQLDFTAGSFTCASLQELAKGCPFLSVLKILQPPISCVHILADFNALRELSLIGCLEDLPNDVQGIQYHFAQLEKLSLIATRPFSSALKWLWWSCRGLKKLELADCQGGGDMGMSVVPCLPFLQEIQLKRCRSIAGGMLMLISEHCPDLRSLTIHDGGDAEGLRCVVQKCGALNTLDLRLPLDLCNEDLMEIAQSCSSLRSLCLHSCWLATGIGIRLMAFNFRSRLEELVLVRCRAVVQDSGTLSAVGQSLPGLKKIDLSDNECLADKELAAMLASCQYVSELKLWKCSMLTDRIVEFISERCSLLESIDIRNCDGITSSSLCSLLSRCSHLKSIGIELYKLSSVAKKLAHQKGIKFLGAGHSTGDALASICA